MFGRATIRLGIGPHSSFNGFRVLAVLLHSTLVVGVSQTAAFNRGRHLYSAGRPSGWALSHILVIIIIQQIFGARVAYMYSVRLVCALKARYLLVCWKNFHLCIS